MMLLRACGWWDQEFQQVFVLVILKVPSQKLKVIDIATYQRPHPNSEEEVSLQLTIWYNSQQHHSHWPAHRHSQLTRCRCKCKCRSSQEMLHHLKDQLEVIKETSKRSMLLHHLILLREDSDWAAPDNKKIPWHEELAFREVHNDSLTMTNSHRHLKVKWQHMIVILEISMEVHQPVMHQDLCGIHLVGEQRYRE